MPIALLWISRRPVIDSEHLPHREIARIPDVLIREIFLAQRPLLSQPTVEVIPGLSLILGENWSHCHVK